MLLALWQIAKTVIKILSKTVNIAKNINSWNYWMVLNGISWHYWMVLNGTKRKRKCTRKYKRECKRKRKRDIPDKRVSGNPVFRFPEYTDL